MSRAITHSVNCTAQVPCPGCGLSMIPYRYQVGGHAWAICSMCEHKWQEKDLDTIITAFRTRDAESFLEAITHLPQAYLLYLESVVRNQNKVGKAIKDARMLAVESALNRSSPYLDPVTSP